MKKIVPFFLGLSFVTILGLSWFWIAGKDAVQAEDKPDAPHPLLAINQKAKDARTGDLSAAEEYVGEIVKVSGFEGELQGFTLTAIKDRVGRAESQYRRGESAAIPEAKIVRTVNGLVSKFNLPDYTRTSDFEVRKLRLGLLPNFPQLISQKNEGMRPLSIGAGFDSQMSPAEAFFVLAMMLQQKLANPDYQLRPSERLDLWKETHNHGNGEDIARQPDQGRSREISQALNRASVSASMSDALQLTDLTLNTLGIEQRGGKR